MAKIKWHPFKYTAEFTELMHTISNRATFKVQCIECNINCNLYNETWPGLYKRNSGSLVECQKILTRMHHLYAR